MSEQRFSKYTIYNQTHRAKDYCKHILERADNIRADPRKEDRLKKAECPVCYYVDSRIGGAAITSKPCQICGKGLTFGNTCVDYLCEDCAKKYGLCKHCGGDIEMKDRKKREPFPWED